MVNKKADFPKITTRVSEESLVEYNRWYRNHKKQFPYATKNMVQAEAIYMISTNKIKFPWEGKK